MPGEETGPHHTIFSIAQRSERDSLSFFGDLPQPASRPASLVRFFRVAGVAIFIVTVGT